MVLHVTSDVFKILNVFRTADHAITSWPMDVGSRRWLGRYFTRPRVQDQLIGMQTTVSATQAATLLKPLKSVNPTMPRWHTSENTLCMLCTTCTHYTAEYMLSGRYGPEVTEERRAKHTLTQENLQKHTTRFTCGYVWIEVWVSTEESREKECSKNSELFRDSARCSLDVCYTRPCVAFERVSYALVSYGQVLLS